MNYKKIIFYLICLSHGLFSDFPSWNIEKKSIEGPYLKVLHYEGQTNYYVNLPEPLIFEDGTKVVRVKEIYDLRGVSRLPQVNSFSIYGIRISKTEIGIPKMLVGRSPSAAIFFNETNSIVISNSRVLFQEFDFEKTNFFKSFCKLANNQNSFPRGRPPVLIVENIRLNFMAKESRQEAFSLLGIYLINPVTVSF